jgi:hypothetical protein
LRIIDDAPPAERCTAISREDPIKRPVPFTRLGRQAGVPVASVECRGKPPGGDGHAPVREKSLARVDDRRVSPCEPAAPASQRGNVTGSRTARSSGARRAKIAWMRASESF